MSHWLGSNQISRYLDHIQERLMPILQAIQKVHHRSTESAPAARYFTSVTLINAGLGVSVWISVGLLGLPHPLLWGVAAFLLHYIPFVGSTGGIVAMTLVSLIHFDSVWYALLPPKRVGSFLGRP